LVKKLLLYIILLYFPIASATEITPPKITTISIATQIQKSVFYKNGSIHFVGFKGFGIIEVYSIIGNKITEISSNDLNGFILPYPLELGNMYIIRILSDRDVITFKIVAS
tara:strand:+ start:353 stop:682 length:330 start_codon:yes stop_codon:yes gene_type:complete